MMRKCIMVKAGEAINTKKTENKGGIKKFDELEEYAICIIGLGYGLLWQLVA